MNQLDANKPKRKQQHRQQKQQQRPRETVTDSEQVNIKQCFNISSCLACQFTCSCGSNKLVALYTPLRIDVVAIPSRIFDLICALYHYPDLWCALCSRYFRSPANKSIRFSVCVFCLLPFTHSPLTRSHATFLTHILALLSEPNYYSFNIYRFYNSLCVRAASIFPFDPENYGRAVLPARICAVRSFHYGICDEAGVRCYAVFQQ